MVIFYAMRNYLTQGFQCFIKNPNTDRSKVTQVATEKYKASLAK